MPELDGNCCSAHQPKGTCGRVFSITYQILRGDDVLLLRRNCGQILPTLQVRKELLELQSSDIANILDGVRQASHFASDCERLLEGDGRWVRFRFHGDERDPWDDRDEIPCVAFFGRRPHLQGGTRKANCLNLHGTNVDLNRSLWHLPSLDSLSLSLSKSPWLHCKPNYLLIKLIKFSLAIPSPNCRPIASKSNTLF